ncbi:MAG: hypothetical protein JSU72_10675 [Deltaproteobacteria bacterium]|nr:MAG: hypothetical protein JSU72_10675 [Deltaproteobacteria bacterium]
MNKAEIVGGGIFLEPDEIDYEEIDPPLRRLIRLINTEPWIRTYGCCAGQSHHGISPGLEQHFFIGLFVSGGSLGDEYLRCWLDEANRLNGPTGFCLSLQRVHQHPFGHGNVGGNFAYRLGIHQAREDGTPALPQTVKRLIRCLEIAWEELWPVSAPGLGIE